MVVMQMQGKKKVQLVLRYQLNRKSLMKFLKTTLMKQMFLNLYELTSCHCQKDVL